VCGQKLTELLCVRVCRNAWSSWPSSVSPRGVGLNLIDLAIAAISLSTRCSDDVVQRFNVNLTAGRRRQFQQIVRMNVLSGCVFQVRSEFRHGHNYYFISYKKVNQSHYRPEVPRGFLEVKVPRLRDNGPGWW